MRTHTRTRSIIRWAALAAFLSAGAAADAVAQTVDNNGGFNYSIPIKVPAGTAGMGPTIALVYNSMAGNGMLGAGWGLSCLSVISRDPSYPINFDINDHYMYQGQPLLLASDGTYHTKREAFLRIKATTPEQATSSWTVTDKNGVTKTFRNIPAVGKGGKALLWALSKVQDVLGNYYTITYDVDATNGDFYPTKIVYTLNDGSGKGFGAYRTVLFTYTDRADHGVKYVPTAMDTNQILTWITVKVGTNANGDGGSLLRKYGLNYDADGGAQRLSKVQEFGNDGDMPPWPWLPWGQPYPATGSWQPPITFGYTSRNNVVDTVTALDALLNLSISGTPADAVADLSRIKFGDFNGDGKTDIYVVRVSHTAAATDSIYLATYEGFAPAIAGVTHPKALSAEAANVDITRLRFADFNGDGRTDVYYVNWASLQNTTDKLYLAAPAGTLYSPISGITHGPMGLYPLPAKVDFARVKVADFNGDGRADIYFVNGSTTGVSATDSVYLSNGNGFGAVQRHHPLDGRQLRAHLQRRPAALQVRRLQR